MMEGRLTITRVLLIVVFVLAAMGAPGAFAGKSQVEPAPAGTPGTTAVAAQATMEQAKKTSGAKSQSKSDGLAAVEKAAKAGKYLFVFLYKDGDQQAEAMQAAFKQATKKVRNRARTVAINIADPAEKAFVDKFKLGAAPTPLVLVLAPNGAITAGIQKQIDDKQVADAFVSPCTEKCLKALQGGKLVLLCVQNATSRSSAIAMQAVTDFKKDPRFSPVTEIVMINPTDEKEIGFLSNLQVDPNSGDAITLLLAPPGAVVRRFAGAFDKGVIMSALNSISSGGCCPGGKSTCSPK